MAGKKKKAIPRMLRELDMTRKPRGNKAVKSSGDYSNKDGQDLDQLPGHDTDIMMTESPPREEDMEDVQATINDLSVRTRAQMSAAKQFAMEAGILAQEMQTGTQDASSSANPKLDSKGENAADEPGYDRVSVPKNPWPGVEGKESKQLWLGWDIVQDKLVRTLESHRYTLRAGRPPYPNLLKDLCSRLDFEGNDASPRTFEPEMKHFQEFNLLLSILQEYGKGREVGFVKIKVPEGAMSTPLDPRPEPEELMVMSYRCRLKPVHKHPTFDVNGIFSVERSKNSNQETAVIWRMIMDEFDRKTVGLLHMYKVPTDIKQQLADGGELPSKIEVQQEFMLDPSGREKIMTFSSDNEGNLGLKNPNLKDLKGNVLANVLPSTKIHLAANVGVARSLRTSPIGAYSLYYLHRGAPVTWTIIDPHDYPRVVAYVHAATHTYGSNASAKRPRKPPQCTASVNHHKMYISHDKLTAWDVGWTAFEQRAGELVVLAPFACAQYYWNEKGVMEEGVYGSELWKSKIAGKGLVTQCSAATCGEVVGDFTTDLKRL
ncbi:MAG: hypothetical protein Q9188_003068 [Gyalolechia gomerana]